MATLSRRQIVVDDTDPRIQYAGQVWFQDGEGQDHLGNFGPVFNHTQHGTNSSTSFLFSFEGSSITVFGTSLLKPASTTTGYDPTWECFVDGVSIGSTKPFTSPENNWRLCDQPTLKDGPHVLMVNVTTSGQTFWLDYIWYTPSSSSSKDVANIVVNHFDPDIVYGSGWRSLGGSANMTTVFGSQLRFNFTGTGLSWYGFRPTELSHNATSAAYSIDAGDPVSFPLTGLPEGAHTTVYNQLFFSTPKLLDGFHSLVVFHGGDNQHTPLTLTHLVVTSTISASVPNSGLDSATSTSGSDPSSTTALTGAYPSSPHNLPSYGSSNDPLAGKPSLSNHSAPLGTILGSTIGSFAFISLALLFVFGLQRRRNRGVPLAEKRRSQRVESPFMLAYRDSSASRMQANSYSQIHNPTWDPNASDTRTEHNSGSFPLSVGR